MSRFATLSILALAASVLGNPLPETAELQARADCVGTITSLASVTNAESCKTININALTLKAKEKLVINAVSGATINLKGNIKFTADTSFQTEGPIFTITGENIQFHGNGFIIDGDGDKYWDGLGSADNAKQKKPHPMIKWVLILGISGLFDNVKVNNSPAQVFSLGNKAALTVSNVHIDNSAGNFPNNISDGKPAAHNTDGFDVSTNDVTIQDSTVINQDDCLAINGGNNITFQRNKCTGGHGISVGSINTGKTVSGVHITGNTIVDNDQALRIKTFATATSGSVSGVTYKDNTATGCKRFGVIIDQSYPNTLSTPGAGVKISGVAFTGNNNIAVASSAKTVEVNCASGGCTGTWDWSGLKVSGGSKGTHFYSGIKGFSQ
ncbi:polygalacturonase [Rhizoctonia solani]|nr:polygalacturonase [Rhizoctonia solani]